MGGRTHGPRGGGWICDVSAEAGGPDARVPDAVPSDLQIARILWPVLLASVVSLLPFTVFSTFLVPIAREAGSGVAAMGSLRGLGGLAALIVGVAFAPLLDRAPRHQVAAGGLVLLAVSALIGVLGVFVAMVAFCLLAGAALSVLSPALGAAAADRFGDGAAAGRAATLVTATQSLVAMLAAPAVALPATVWGWRGDLLAVAVVALLLALILRRWAPAGARGGERERLPGYTASFRALVHVPGAVPLLAVSVLRAAAFMGYLSYLAAFYDARFQLGAGAFALVWTLSGTSFFVGNLLVGRYTNRVRPRFGPEQILLVGLLVALGAVVGIFFTTALPLALLLTALLGASHAGVAACVVGLLVRRSGPLRGSALSVNAAGMSLGTFAGAALGGLGLALAGYSGAASVFGGLTFMAVVAASRVCPSRK